MQACKAGRIGVAESWLGRDREEGIHQNVHDDGSSGYRCIHLMNTWEVVSHRAKNGTWNKIVKRVDGETIKDGIANNIVK